MDFYIKEALAGILFVIFLVFSFWLGFTYPGPVFGALVGYIVYKNL
jgi:hypothetical protein